MLLMPLSARVVPHSSSEIYQPFFENAGTSASEHNTKITVFMGKETLQNLLVRQFGESS
jgi:hypothetical protein